MVVMTKSYIKNTKMIFAQRTALELQVVTETHTVMNVTHGEMELE